jgi:hypothetical protein
MIKSANMQIALNAPNELVFKEAENVPGAPPSAKSGSKPEPIPFVPTLADLEATRDRLAREGTWTVTRKAWFDQVDRMTQAAKSAKAYDLTRASAVDPKKPEAGDYYGTRGEGLTKSDKALKKQVDTYFQKSEFADDNTLMKGTDTLNAALSSPPKPGRAKTPMNLTDGQREMFHRARAFMIQTIQPVPAKAGKSAGVGTMGINALTARAPAAKQGKGGTSLDPLTLTPHLKPLRAADVKKAGGSAAQINFDPNQLSDFIRSMTK